MGKSQKKELMERVESLYLRNPTTHQTNPFAKSKRQVDGNSLPYPPPSLPLSFYHKAKSREGHLISSQVSLGKLRATISIAAHSNHLYMYNINNYLQLQTLKKIDSCL